MNPQLEQPGSKLKAMTTDHKHDLEGTLFALLGILLFSMTLTATRVIVPVLGGTFVGLGRALLAAILAGIVLISRREKLPERRYWRSICITALGVVFGFPLLSSLALKSVPAIHAVVIVGLLPAMTATLAVIRTRERTTPLFWAAVVLGVIGILVFAVIEGAGAPQPADALLFGAGLLGAVGYVEGGILAKEMDGWRVISWALIFSVPFLIPPVMLNLPSNLPNDPIVWICFIYVGAISMYLGFFAWYKGLALAGIARSSALQVLQPLFSMIWAVFLLHEALHIQTVFAAIIVIASATLSRFARMKRTT
jgi:drug/metabolite transporter (DMT)-like permease